MSDQRCSTITWPADQAGKADAMVDRSGWPGIPMIVSELLNCRLSNTGLCHSPFHQAGDAVNHLGADQAQDFAATKWALRLRVRT